MTSPAQIIAKLDAAQVNPAFDVVARRMFRSERADLTVAIQRRARVAETAAEAVRVAAMYGLTI